MKNSTSGHVGRRPYLSPMRFDDRPADRSRTSNSRCASSSPAPRLRVLVNSDSKMQRFELRVNKRVSLKTAQKFMEIAAKYRIWAPLVCV